MTGVKARKKLQKCTISVGPYSQKWFSCY